MQTQKNSFLLLAFPLTLFILLGLVLYVERTGVIYTTQSSSLKLLNPDAIPQPSKYTDSGNPECLILFNSAEENWKVFFQIARDTTAEMRVQCNSFDMNTLDEAKPLDTYNLSNFQTVLVTFRQISSENQFEDLMQWVQSGGRALFTQPQKLTPVFLKYINEMGIQAISDGSIKVKGIKFTTDLMPGSKGLVVSPNETFVHGSLPVILKNTTLVHMTSSDDYSLPLLWETSSGKGRVVYINSTAFYNKNSRGVIGAAYSLLQDAFIYPVINSSLYFIDDFPSPIPDGQDSKIRDAYNLDNRSFFEKVWWPEIYALAKDYGLKFTGGLIETYSYTTKPPLEQLSNWDDFRRMGGYLLKDGGQIGLHGYNHLPLCLETDGANLTLDMPSWPSRSAMQGAVEELNTFAQLLYPGLTFSVYVPPSNILCSDMRWMLPKLLPELKVIASLYLSSDEGIEQEMSYVQEFIEASDGIIELPRISSGYHMNEYWKYVIVNETSLHYVQSHFIHPDDVLDEIRSENKTWKQLKVAFDNDVQWRINAAPGIRQMTADEGGAALQRYYRLKVNSRFDDQGTQMIILGNFYDEAWLLLRTSQPPKQIEGGTFTQVTSTLYLIHASNPELIIRY